MILNKIKKKLLERKSGFFLYKNQNIKEALKSCKNYDDIESAGFRATENIDFNDLSNKLLSYQVISCLLRFCNESNNKKLNVLDFGGGNGSYYFLSKSFLEKIEINWDIVEKEFIFNLGNSMNFYKNHKIKFYKDIKDIKNIPDVIIVSGSLQYLDEPEKKMKELSSLGAKYIILDRTQFLKKSGISKILTIQRWNSFGKILETACWILSKKDIYDNINGYEMINEFYKGRCKRAGRIGSAYWGSIWKLSENKNK